MNSLPQRHNFKWNINELLSLQREYELLEMSIQDISAKHGRTVVSILYKLQQEGFIETWVDARGYQEFSKTQSYLVGSLDCEESVSHNNNDSDSDYEEELDDDEDYVEDEDEDEFIDVDENDENISSLNQRVWSLETAVNDIKGVIGSLLSRFNTSSKPLKKLRQPQLSVEI
jgi:hypothetical protein